MSKKHKIFQIIQGPIVVVIIGIVFNILYQNAILPFELNAKQIVSLPVPRSINDFLNQFSFPNFNAIGSFEVWKIAFVIAIVASIETLLCVEATDKLDVEKELLQQILN